VGCVGACVQGLRGQAYAKALEASAQPARTSCPASGAGPQRSCTCHTAVPAAPLRPCPAPLSRTCLHAAGSGRRGRSLLARRSTGEAAAAAAAVAGWGAGSLATPGKAVSLLILPHPRGQSRGTCQGAAPAPGPLLRALSTWDHTRQAHTQPPPTLLLCLSPAACALAVVMQGTHASVLAQQHFTAQLPGSTPIKKCTHTYTCIK